VSEEVPCTLVNLKKVRGAWMLPRPDWDVIEAWIGEHVAKEDRSRAWSEVVEQWLDRLGRALEGGYRLVGAKELRLFTAEKDEESVRGLLTFAEAALNEIRKLIGDLAAGGWRGPLPLLHFNTHDDYYGYLSQFYPEGEHGGSGGCFCQSGYVHVAIAPIVGAFQLTAAHELTHACLFHLRLPVWLEEGVTQHMEVVVDSWAMTERRGPLGLSSRGGGAMSNWGHGAMTDDELLDLRRFWRKEGLSDFWWGRGFSRADEGQRHSYALSRVLFQLLLSDYPGKFRGFIAQARAADAGESAARSALGLELGDLAAKFLGNGDWTPRPPNAAAFSDRGAFHLAAGRFAEALADGEESLRLEPRLSQGHYLIGDICAAGGEYARAVCAFEKAVELSPRHLASCNMLAWLKATCPVDAVRDGESAVELATRACELTGFAASAYLDTLAAAHAEVGDFEEACRWQKEAIRMAPAEEKEDCRSRLQLYRAGRPMRLSQDTPVARG
jgi:hypothetical protein